MSNHPFIMIRGLYYDYPDGRRALSDITLRIRRGERLGIIGPNGAGKSTLLLHLNGILRGRGEISVAGRAVEKQNLRAIRRAVGLVFQDPDDQLFTPTLYEDVAYGPLQMHTSTTADIAQCVREALSIVGMEDCIHRSSHHLSLGEKKKAALATVLAMKPELIALDEPTSNLDPGSRREIIHHLLKLPATLVIATHDLDMVDQLCHRTVVLNRGHIVAEGDTPDILGDRALMEEHGLSFCR